MSKLSERIYNFDACTRSDENTFNRWADEVAQLEAELERKTTLLATWVNKYTDLEAERDALVLRTGICEWEYDTDSDVWMGLCGNIWHFESEGPEENGCHYCMFCGGVIEATRKEIEGGE